jgi:hypothetical protein
MEASIMKGVKPIVMLALAAILLMCLLKMPYSYYQFVRVAAFLGFTALSCMWDRKHLFASLFAACAVLFNPLFPIHMGRMAWNIVDAGISLFLIITVIKMTTTKHTHSHENIGT